MHKQDKASYQKLPELQPFLKSKPIFEDEKRKGNVQTCGKCHQYKEEWKDSGDVSTRKRTKHTCLTSCPDSSHEDFLACPTRYLHGIYEVKK